jgi:hypothetical protein
VACLRCIASTALITRDLALSPRIWISDFLAVNDMVLPFGPFGTPSFVVLVRLASQQFQTALSKILRTMKKMNAQTTEYSKSARTLPKATGT